DDQADVGVSVSSTNETYSEVVHPFGVIEALNRDRSVAVFMVLVSAEVRLSARIHASTHWVGISHYVHIATDGYVLHADELPDVIYVIESVLDRYRLLVVHDKANKGHAHHTSASGHTTNGLVGLVTHERRRESAAVGV